MSAQTIHFSDFFPDMSQRPSILHPHDPAVTLFDFHRWRVMRRLVADRLRALSSVHPTTVHLARAIETETLDEDGLDALRTLLASEQEAAVSNNDELFHALERVLARYGLQSHDSWHLPSIKPDWTTIPLSRTVFFGTVDGLRLGARLENGSRPIPASVIVWIRANGSESEPQPLDAKMGEFLSYAPAIWDWLVARRLTLLCAAGVLQWPATAPLRIEDISVPARGF